MTKTNYYREFPLKRYIFKTYKNIEPNYQILEQEDISIMEDILKLYQEELIENYFCESLSVDKNLLSVLHEEYFFYTLLCYLDRHNCSTTLCGHTKYSLISMENYGQYGGQLYDAKYSLTKFGMIYQKLFYASCIFCENNERTKRFLNRNISNGVKDCIDKNEMQISRV